MNTPLQQELDLEVGTKMHAKLEPQLVHIESVEVKPVGNKNAKKVVCSCKHPDTIELISLSTVQYREKNTIKESGLWVNKDNEGKLQKGSALANMLEKLGCQKLGDLVGKDIATDLDTKGYLAFKIY